MKSALIQAGLKIDTERGVSDEGDPWFAFCRPDDGEVIVHIARIGGLYVLAGPSYEGVSTGRDIATLVRDLVGRHPLIQTRGNNGRHGSNIFLHPAALLIAVVATAFFKSTEARALTDDHKSGDGRSGGGGTAAAGGGSGVTVRPEPVSAFETQKTVVMDAVQSAVILSAIAAVLQTPTTYAPEQTVTNAVAANSELLDFGALALLAPHSVGGLPDAGELRSSGDGNPKSPRHPPGWCIPHYRHRCVHRTRAGRDFAGAARGRGCASGGWRSAAFGGGFVGFTRQSIDRKGGGARG